MSQNEKRLLSQHEPYQLSSKVQTYQTEPVERPFLKDHIKKIGFAKNLARDDESDMIFTDGGAYSDFSEEVS